MNDSPRLPYGYEDNVTCTEDKTGRVVIHWPEGCRGTVISRELLDAIVEEKNNCPRWIPVSEKLPDEGQNVLAYSKRMHNGVSPGSVCVFKACTFYGLDWLGIVTASHWQPLPEPPEVK